MILLYLGEKETVALFRSSAHIGSLATLLLHHNQDLTRLSARLSQCFLSSESTESVNPIVYHDVNELTNLLSAETDSDTLLIVFTENSADVKKYDYLRETWGSNLTLCEALTSQPDPSFSGYETSKVNLVFDFLQIPDKVKHKQDYGKLVNVISLAVTRARFRLRIFVKKEYIEIFNSLFSVSKDPFEKILIEARNGETDIDLSFLDSPQITRNPEDRIKKINKIARAAILGQKATLLKIIIAKYKLSTLTDLTLLMGLHGNMTREFLKQFNSMVGKRIEQLLKDSADSMSFLDEQGRSFDLIQVGNAAIRRGYLGIVSHFIKNIFWITRSKYCHNIQLFKTVSYQIILPTLTERIRVHHRGQ